EVRAVEEEEDEEEDELVLVPGPPHAPRDLRPDRAGGERQRSEDHTLVDGDVALEVRPLVLRPQVPECLPGAPPEGRVRRQRERDVEVEDALRQALVGVGRRVEERERGPEPEEARAERRERGQGRRSHGGIVVPARRQASATTYSKAAQLSSPKIAS